jgi:hypothetical protein
MAVSGHQDYWNVNVPEKDQTQECPLPLANVNAADRKQLAIPDAQFHVMSWQDVKDVISTDLSIHVCNDLDTKQAEGNILRRRAWIQIPNVTNV